MVINTKLVEPLKGLFLITYLSFKTMTTVLLPTGSQYQKKCWICSTSAYFLTWNLYEYYAINSKDQLLSTIIKY